MNTYFYINEFKKVNMEYNSAPILGKIRKRISLLKSQKKSTQGAEHLVNLRSRIDSNIDELNLVKQWITEG